MNSNEIDVIKEGMKCPGSGDNYENDEGYDNIDGVIFCHDYAMPCTQCIIRTLAPELFKEKNIFDLFYRKSIGEIEALRDIIDSAKEEFPLRKEWYNQEYEARFSWKFNPREVLLWFMKFFGTEEDDYDYEKYYLRHPYTLFKHSCRTPSYTMYHNSVNSNICECNICHETVTY